MAVSETEHVDYPHHPGTLYDCRPCENQMAMEAAFWGELEMVKREDIGRFRVVGKKNRRVQVVFAQRYERGDLVDVGEPKEMEVG